MFWKIPNMNAWFIFKIRITVLIQKIWSLSTKKYEFIIVYWYISEMTEISFSLVKLLQEFYCLKINNFFLEILQQLFVAIRRVLICNINHLAICVCAA